MYKNQLQELAQRSCFNPPSYACIREGPDHAPRFKATVNFNGEIFESPSFFSTLRQAEHAAAEVALNTLAKRGSSNTLAAKALDETGVCKNLLQETAHRAGLDLPVYTTVHSGPGHVPVFSCTVELAGMTFTGEPAKTKKQAQKHAAMAAWSALKQMSQRGSSSPSTSSGCQEEQEQVVVARFLASLNPTVSSNSPSPQSNQQKVHHKSSSRTYKNSVPPTPTSFGARYQNWASSNLSPQMAIHQMWLQEQAVEQQRRLMALPVPIAPPVPPPNQVVSWMHSMLQPSHPPYCSPLYLSNQFVPDPLKTATMMTAIQVIQEGKPEDPCELVSNEKLQKDCMQESLPQNKNTTSEKGSLGLGTMGSSIRLSQASASNYCDNAGTALPGLSQATLVEPTLQSFRAPVTASRLHRGVNSNSGRPGLGRMQAGGPRSPFTAPAVHIRSVTPVCSAAPPRRISSSAHKTELRDDVRNETTGDVLNMGSKLGNLHI